MTLKLVLADDHPIVLDGLERLFRGEAGFEVVARCVNGREALAAVRRHRPDVLVLDLRMPDMGGLDLLRCLAAERIAARAVVLTAGVREHEILEAVRLGAFGVVLKESAPGLLVECVRSVARGERHLPRFLTRALEDSETSTAEPALTPRELELVRLVALGLRNKEIADRLSITEGTVKVHLHNIYDKLGLDGRLALLRYAEDHGVV
ncbi:MAG TPA: response regulator transcription factor [Thermoanaerobaculia bacterium]|nr:response regulator transcription factor [Thermoanaerobaculia bacterium]